MKLCKLAAFSEETISSCRRPTPIKKGRKSFHYGTKLLVTSISRKKKKLIGTVKCASPDTSKCQVTGLTLEKGTKIHPEFRKANRISLANLRSKLFLPQSSGLKANRVTTSPLNTASSKSNSSDLTNKDKLRTKPNISRNGIISLSNIKFKSNRIRKVMNGSTLTPTKELGQYNESQSKVQSSCIRVKHR